MSLLHKALKKAEKTGQGGDINPAFLDTEERPKASPVRLALFGGIALAALLLAAYVRLVDKPASPEPSAKEFKTPLEIAGGPGAVALQSEAFLSIQQGRLDKARDGLQKVVILDPRNAEAYNNLGYVLRKLGRPEEAMEQYRMALSLSPDCAECLNNLGVLYLSQRELPEAEQQFRKAVQARPDYADPYFHLAMVEEARGDLSQARKDYLKFIELAKGLEASFLLKVQQRIASLQSP